MKALKKVVRGVTLAELWATALTFVIMVVCYFISVVNRNFIKGSMPWTEELALYCMVYMALIGTELGLRDGTQVSVTALTEKLKGTMVGKVINHRSSAGARSVAHRREHGHQRHPLWHDPVHLQRHRYHDPSRGRQHLLGCAGHPLCA